MRPLFALLILLAPLTALAAGLETQTDPYNNAGTAYFAPLTSQYKDEILPNAIKPYIPTGSIASDWGAKDLRNAPDIGAVEAIIIFIAQAFSTKPNAGETGKWIWKLPIYFTVFGLFLTGFLTFQSVAQGKKGPGEGLIAFLTKIVICIIFLNFICPNVPPMLIGLSNTITSGIDNWFTTTGNSSNDNTQIQSLYASKTAIGHAQAAAVLSSLEDAILIATQATPDKGKSIIDQIKSDALITKVTGANYQAKEDLPKILDMYRSGNHSQADISGEISVIAHSYPRTVMERVYDISHEVLGKDTQTKQADQAILEAINAAPRNLDLTGTTYPPRILSTYAYISFAYLAISIWGMGIASLIWVMLFSLPDEWNLNGILLNGVKGGVSVILAIVLITIYLAAGMSWNDRQSSSIAKTATEGIVAKTASVLETINSFSLVGGVTKAFQAGKTAYDLATSGNPGQFVPQLFGQITGISLEMLMIGLLIFTAPAQAALMVKGGNGIAEHAKSAMSASGASSGGLGAMVGNWGGSSGANMSGNFSAQSIMNGRGTDRSAIMGPSKPGIPGIAKE